MPAKPRQLKGSFPLDGAGPRTWETLLPGPSPQQCRDQGGAREGAGCHLDSDSLRPPPPRWPGPARPLVRQSPQGLKAATGEVGGAANSGKRSAGPRMKAESAVSHGRSCPRSLARLLARLLPPALRPPAASLRPSSAASRRFLLRPPLALGSCPSPLESPPAREAQERPSGGRHPAVPGARAQPRGRNPGQGGEGCAHRGSSRKDAPGTRHSLLWPRGRWS